MKRVLVTQVLFFCLFGCHQNLDPATLLIWAPQGGVQSERISELCREMGIPCRLIGPQDLKEIPTKNLGPFSVLLCFEGARREDLSDSVLYGFLKKGGSVVLVADSTVLLQQQGGYTPKVTADNYLRWLVPARFRLLPGSYDDQDGTALTYSYGPRQLPGWFFEGVQGEVWALDTSRRPRWVEQPFGAGSLVLVGLPAATLAVKGDSQPARLLLEWAAERAALPRLWPTPMGLGGLVVNIHVDDALTIRYLPELLHRWPKEVRGTWHVIAGPDIDAEGDRKGFNTKNPARGLPWLARFKAIGEVGSHGGWIHNLWANHVAEWSLERQERYLALNRDALASVGPITSFSGPGGNHPETINPWLVAHGFKSFYLVGENGGSPTHAWLKGRRFGAPMWAWPVATFGASAATYEYKERHVTEPEVTRWAFSVVDFCRDRRALHLLYGHPVDFHDMPQAYLGAFEHLGQQVRDGRMSAWTMADYTDFLQRHSSSTLEVRRHDNNLQIRVQGPSLKDLALRIPGVWKLRPQPGLRVRQEEGDTWLRFEDSRTDWEGKLSR